MTPACPSCNAPLAPYGPKGYDSAYQATCGAQESEDCPVDICSECAGFYEPDADIDHDGYHVDRTQARCRPCEDLREARRFAAKVGNREEAA